MRSKAAPWRDASSFSRLNPRAFALAQLVLQLVDLAMKRSDLGLEPAHAFGQVGRRGTRHDRRGLLVVVERDAELKACAPLHLGAIGLVLVGDMELDDLRDGDRIRDLELGTGPRNGAPEAIEARAPVVEIEAALQEASLARTYAAFI